MYTTKLLNFQNIGQHHFYKPVNRQGPYSIRMGVPEETTYLLESLNVTYLAHLE